MTKKMKLYLKLRDEAEGGLTTVWLVQADGAAAISLLYGVMPKQLADALAAHFHSIKIETERTSTAIGCAGEPRPETTMKKHRTLFDESEATQ